MRFLLQNTRLEEQRSALPSRSGNGDRENKTTSAQADPSLSVGPTRAKQSGFPGAHPKQRAPTVPDDDFFQMIMDKMQQGR